MHTPTKVQQNNSTVIKMLQMNGAFKHHFKNNKVQTEQQTSAKAHTYASNQNFMLIDTLSYMLSSKAGTVVMAVHRHFHPHV